MYHNIKEKSWSVRLIEGYVLNDQVRAQRCENCRSTTEILVANYGNPNLLLYGCKESKCKHRMLRLDFEAGVQNEFPFKKYLHRLPVRSLLWLQRLYPHYHDMPLYSLEEKEISVDR
jgi:hypothetical protein